MLEAQTHRRFIKTHLPVDALVFSPKAKYIYVARDGRDVAWSLHNHQSCRYLAYQQAPKGPPIEKPHEDILQYYFEWFEKDGYPN
jgi:aryl sulfotransferase